MTFGKVDTFFKSIDIEKKIPNQYTLIVSQDFLNVILSRQADSILPYIM